MSNADCCLSRFITCFVTVFATVIAITKDLADVEGDRKFGVETFSTRLGVRNVAYLGASAMQPCFICLHKLTTCGCKRIPAFRHAICVALLVFPSISVDVALRCVVGTCVGVKVCIRPDRQHRQVVRVG